MRGTKQRKLVLRACVRYLSERRSLLSQEKRQSCLLITLEPIRRISRAWSARFGFPLAGTIKKRREILKREEKSPSFPFEGNEGLPSLHGEKRATARPLLLGEKRATARPLLLGEKRATARPLLLQWSGMCEGGYCRDSSPLTSFTYVRQADIKV